MAEKDNFDNDFDNFMDHLKSTYSDKEKIESEFDFRRGLIPESKEKVTKPKHFTEDLISMHKGGPAPEKEATKPRTFSDDLISMAPRSESSFFSSAPPVYDTISRGTSYQPPVSVPAKSNRPVASEKGKQQYTDSLNKSVGPKKAVPTAQKKEATQEEISVSKKAAKVILTIVVTAALFIGGLISNFTSDTVDFLKVSDYLSQYSNIAAEGTIHARNGTLNYWYDEGLMGQRVAEAADPEAALYSVYSDINYLQRTVLQNVYSEAVSRNPELFGGQPDFKSYADSLGCVDKDGEIDYDEYEKVSEERILAKATLDQYTDQATTGK